MYNTHDPQVLPPRDGVRPSCVVQPSQGHGLILDFLVQRLPLITRDDWLHRMQRGEVLNEYGDQLTAHTPLQPGLRIYYYREVEVEIAVPFEAAIIYQDAHLVVADKPHFLPVTPGGRYLQNTLLVRLKRQLNLPELSPVHRIDRDTAGLVMFSAQRQDRGAYQALFRDCQVKKAYEAIAPFKKEISFPREHSSRLSESGDFIRMKEAAGVPNSHTKMQVIEVENLWARYLLMPVSGKRHQLRVHMASLGLGLWGDGLYPQVRNAPEGDFSRPLQLLAKTLEFTDPITGIHHKFTSQRNLRSLSDGLES